MQKEEKKYPPIKLAQKAIIYNPNDNKFLLVKRKEREDKDYKDFSQWEFPGGTMDRNEELEESLSRGIQEEIGNIDFEIIDIFHRDSINSSDGKKRIVLYYLAKYIKGDIKLSEEHIDYKWVTAEETNKDYKNWVKGIINRANNYLEKENALDSWKRCQADFENYKKSQAKQQDEFRKYAKMDVIEQILPVVDNFEASLAHVPEKSKENKWVEGIVYIKKQLEGVLRNNDIEEIAVKPGDKFNPEVHEAVGGDGEKQKITKIIQKGYKLNGRIVRAAKVEVS